MRLTIPALAIVLALVAPAVAQQPEQPRAGGVFRVAMIGEPPTLDLHTTTAVIVQQITWHIYEGLYTTTARTTPRRCSPRATVSATAGGPTPSSSVAA